MSKYRAKTNIYCGGKQYKEGEVYSLTDKEAKNLADDIEKVSERKAPAGKTTRKTTKRKSK